MTDLRTAHRPPDSDLQDLLLANDRDPAALVEGLAAAREELADAAGLRLDVARAELRFLRAHAAPDAPFELAAAVQRAEQAELALERRCLERRPDGDPDALFDLAELRACLRLHGMEEAAASVGGEIERRARAIALDDALREEARERYVALAADEEEPSLRRKALLLEETAALLRRLGERGEDRELRRLAKRLWRRSCDRVLALRLERVLGARGAALLENTSFLLLVALLALLAVETLAPLAPGTARLFLTLDAAICMFFVVEFAFKLALAPAKRSWFLRNVVTDLLPALPAALLFLDVPRVPHATDTAWVRALRFLRVAYFARYVRALRPVLRLVRLVLFMVRGLDELVARFAPLLNRNFVFFEPAGAADGGDPGHDPRGLALRALRREHVLLAELPDDERLRLLRARALRLEDRLSATDALASAPPREGPVAGPSRDVPVERVIEQLRALRAEDLLLWLPRAELLALDRVARVLNAPLVRSLPFIRRLRSDPVADTPEERVVGLGCRIADRLERWRDRLLFFADLHGVLTGPQILDRVATALIQASKRPAVRLLMFGALFVLVQLALGSDSGVGRFLEKFVATPLIVLGGVCLVVLATGRWLKRIAGEAAETLKRTAEAHFIGLLELVKSRQEDEDTRFLARRVFRWEVPESNAQEMLLRGLEEVRSGQIRSTDACPPELRRDVTRLVLLYLHFLDGAILHETDAKTTEQLLANLSLENIRTDHLRFSRRDRKRLRKLSLMEAQSLGGPYLWFRCITESVALETAKRVVEYNRHCVPIARRPWLADGAVRRMEEWMMRRRGELSGRTLERQEPRGAGTVYVTTEFNALDFLSVDPEREEHVRCTFGEDLLRLLRDDRRRMVREIFGTSPLDRLPRARRTVNFHALYHRWLSGGRVLLLPLLWLGLMWRVSVVGMRKTWLMVQEITAPERALRERPSGAAPFAVALRKIHRMKAPGLLEAMETRAAFDPAYSGVPVTWSEGQPREARPEIERDMDFLEMRERERERLRAIAARVRRRVEGAHTRLRRLGQLFAPPRERGLEAAAAAAPPRGGLAEPVREDGEVPGALEHRLGERSVTIAAVTDRWGLWSLLGAEDWFERRLREYEAPGARIRASRLMTLLRWLARGCRRHPVVQWLRGPLAHRKVSRRARRNFVAAWQRGDEEVRATVSAWLALPPGVRPRDRAADLARRAFFDHAECSRELTAMRAIQSLSVLDVRNYRRLVFRLGGYADDGEDPALADALP